MDRSLVRALPDPLEELHAGIAFWRMKRTWPSDFHNAAYRAWAAEQIDFSDAWWTPFLTRLRAWKATRPASSEEVTTRFVERREALSRAWAEHCAPCRDLDITNVTWDQVGEFADLVGELKPMKRHASPVFTSKFCHFVLPAVFPVVDNEASGNRWPSYQQYFDHVRSLWASTPHETRAALVGVMTNAVDSSGTAVDPKFPIVNKIVELRLIGRQHPVGGSLPETRAPGPVRICQVLWVGRRRARLFC